MTKDYYKILGINENASEEEIKKAYRTLAKKYHPDVSSEENALEKFKEINEAYETLSNKDKKYIYDSTRNMPHQNNDTYYNRSYTNNFYYAKICPICGSIVDVKSKFCTNCMFDFTKEYEKERRYQESYFTGSIVHGFILGFIFNIIGFGLSVLTGKKRTILGSFWGLMIFIILVGILI